MRILCIGDVVASVGCQKLAERLPAIKRQYHVDVCIVNGENAADGNGLTPTAFRMLMDSGADVVTGGNHSFRRREMYDLYDENPFVLRPANFPSSVPGHGACMVDRGRYQVLVVNLMGLVYMEPLSCPFETLDTVLKQYGSPRFCVVDFHAEATAEKKALAYYADGRISALFGTHTHVQTADEQILPNGTGFITDVGMTGPANSVLGICPEQSISKMKGKLPVRFTAAPGPVMINGVLFEIDDRNGKTVNVTRLNIL
ncbi:MAG: TIGR00282 family metallophosphoesterase [Clostridia bacterium]|nr:TIGR00282 family metallophosphoesterase [Clostridia bacterium]